MKIVICKLGNGDGDNFPDFGKLSPSPFPTHFPYELEETLPSENFIRISNSCIVNIKYIECFDLGIIGNILVKFKDGSTENVSKRKVSEVMRFLKERR